MWKNEKTKKKRKSKGITADRPNKTINIDLCFVPAKEENMPDLSAFFQQMGEVCENSPELGEDCAVTTEDCGPGIFSCENMNYDEKMDAYVLMRKNKGGKQEDSKKTNNIEEMERKAIIKQEEEELRAWRRNIRIERKKEDEKWRKYREKRLKLKKGREETSKDEFREEKKRSDEEWKKKTAERKELTAKRKKEDEEWRNKRKEIKENTNVIITSLVAILVIIDNCTRKCLGLPVFIKGRKITADDIIKALKNRLPPELKYIISDNGKQFIFRLIKLSQSLLQRLFNDNVPTKRLCT